MCVTAGIGSDHVDLKGAIDNKLTVTEVCRLFFLFLTFDSQQQHNNNNNNNNNEFRLYSVPLKAHVR